MLTLIGVPPLGYQYPWMQLVMAFRPVLLFEIRSARPLSLTHLSHASWIMDKQMTLDLERAQESSLQYKTTKPSLSGQA